MTTSLLPTGSIRRFGRCLRIFSISTAGLVLLGSMIGILGSLVLPSTASALSSSPVITILPASPGGSSTSSTCNSSSLCSLPHAISIADSIFSGDAVTIKLVSDSGETCTTTSPCTFDGNFFVSSGSEASLTIEGTGTGSNSSAASVLNGGGTGSTLILTNSASFPVTLDNVTVTGGNSYGGGITNAGTMTVTDSTISGNTASYEGGGIYNNGGTMTVTDSTISGNTAGSNGGGGIFNYSGTMTVADSIISDNTASSGGGGITNAGTMTVTDSTISGNSTGSGGSGGGIFNYSGTMTVADSIISGNTASYDGGGIYNNSSTSTMTVTDSTISGNTASSNGGGGIYNSGGTMTVADSTISGNSSSSGGGIYNNGTTTFAGSIVADQTSGGNCSGSVIDAGYNLSNGTSCGFGTTSGSTSKDSVTNLDLSTTLANNGGPTETIAIPGSSAAAAFISSPATVTLGGISINLCSDTSYTTSSGYKANLSVDQRGVSRPATGCSAGAYQYQAPLTVTSITPTVGSTVGGTTVTITGSGFSSGATVDFGTVAGTSVTDVSSTSITVVSPAEVTGTVNVTVTVNSRTSGTVSGDQFTYEAAYTALTPTRICDTRSAIGGTGDVASGVSGQCANSGTPLSASSPLDVTVAGIAGVPTTGVSAVVLNVTSVNQATAGFVTVYPAGASQPSTSNLNFKMSDAVANLVEVGVGSNGQVAISSDTTTDIVVDVEGYYSVPAAAGQGLYNGLSAPARICDTRSGNPSNLTGGDAQCNSKTLAPGTPLSVQVTGNGGIPSFGVTAVVLNLTAVGYTSGGYLTAYSGNITTPPLVSNVNFHSGEGAVPNRVIVPVSSTGTINLVSDVTTDALVDVNGYFTTAGSSSTGAQFNAEAAPVRILDTRCAVSPAPSYCAGENIPTENASIGTVGSGKTITVTVTGLANVPKTATAVVLNVTVTNTSTGGYLVVYPGSGKPPTASDLNWTKGTTTANLVIATPSSTGTVTIYNFSGTTDVMVDVMGWY